ncbi:hypothetical protein Q0F98_16425 [Paenibacillus amylolyticus]|nr:hypothetical protein Q0F98_16425 [Paenibacillus amylolyticus]
MKGFRGIRQPGKDRVHEQSGEHRTAEDKNNMSMSTFSVNKKRVLASCKWIVTAACGVFIAASLGFCRQTIRYCKHRTVL